MFSQSEVIGTHKKSVTAVKFSPDEKFLVSASADQTCMVFSGDGEKRSELEAAHSEGLNDVEWMNNCGSSTLATAADDKMIKIWDVETGKVVTTLQGHENFVFSLAAHPHQSFLMSASEDETLRLWDLRCSSLLIHSLQAHEEPLTSVCFHPTGDHVVSSSYDGLVRLWDFRTLACRRTFSLAMSPATGKMVPAAHAQYTPNGNFLLTSCLDSTLRLIRPFHSPLDDPSSPSSTCEQTSVHNLHKRLRRSCPVRAVEVVRSFTGHTARKFSCPAIFIKMSSESVSVSEETDLNESNNDGYEDEKYDGTLLLCGSEDRDIVAWDLQSQRIEERLSGHTGPVLALHHSDEHRTVVSGAGGSDFSVKLWKY